MNRQRGFGLIVYAIAGIAFLGAVGGLYYKVNNDGYQRGKSEIETQWAAANAAAQQKAYEDRKRVEAARAAQDKEASRRLANARKTNQELVRSLEAHIKASGTAADCRITDGLLGAWNAANKGGQGERPGTVPPASGPAAPAK